MVENRRVEYRGERIEEILNFVNNLKEEENLELLNYVLVINTVY